VKKIKKVYENWCKISDKIRFILVGGYNAGFSYIIFVIALLLIGKEHHQICVALQWLISSVFSFINQKIFVFCTKGNWISEYFKCCATWVVSYVCNAVLLELILRFIIPNVFVAQLISIMFSAIITYILFKHFAFKVYKQDC